MNSLKKYIFEIQSQTFSFFYLVYRLYFFKFLIKKNKKYSFQQIIHINTFQLGGGAAKVANDLINDQKLKYEVKFLVDKINVQHSNVFEIPKKIETRRVKMLKFIEEKKQWQDIFKLNTYKFLKKNSSISNFRDIIHLHNLHGGYFSPLELIPISRKFKTIWTLHDMHAFTGHCSHSFSCEKWLIGCGDCPDLSIYPKIKVDSSKKNFFFKKNVYKSIDTHIVVPSNWLAEKVKLSCLSHLPLDVIYNGVNIEKFKKKDKNIVRKNLGIPTEKKVVMFSADMGLKNPFKGGEYVLKMLDQKEFEDMIFITLGGDEFIKNGNLWSYPYIKSEDELASFYNAADVLLYPSLADNCPLVVLEAMACGLPIVAFNVGGIPELVLNAENGYVVSVKNFQELKSSLLDILLNEELRKEFSLACIKRVNAYFTLEIMNLKYLNLYKNVI